MYIYIYRIIERERERERAGCRGVHGGMSVGCIGFKE